MFTMSRGFCGAVEAIVAADAACARHACGATARMATADSIVIAVFLINKKEMKRKVIRSCLKFKSLNNFEKKTYLGADIDFGMEVAEFFCLPEHRAAEQGVLVGVGIEGTMLRGAHYFFHERQ